MDRSDRLKIVQSVEIPKPCHESWDRMKGDAKTRFCDHCSHTVTDLSMLTQREAAKLLNRIPKERLCVRFQEDSSGRVVFKSDRSASRWFRQPVATLFGAFLATLGLAPSVHAEDTAVQGNKPSCEDSSQPANPVQYKLGEAVAVPSPTPVSTPAPTPSVDLPAHETSANPVPLDSSAPHKMGKVVIRK